MKARAARKEGGVGSSEELWPRAAHAVHAHAYAWQTRCRAPLRTCVCVVEMTGDWDDQAEPEAIERGLADRLKGRRCTTWCVIYVLVVRVCVWAMSRRQSCSVLDALQTVRGRPYGLRRDVIGCIQGAGRVYGIGC